MTKSTVTYWNPLSSDNAKQWQPIEGLEDMAEELESTWYGMREFFIKDCNGYLLGFAERHK